MLPEKKILHELKVLETVLKRHIEADARKHQYEGITGMQMMVLDYMTRRNGTEIYQKDIALHFSVRNATVTGIIQKMEKNGLVIRKAADGDARLKKLTVTEKGINVAKDAGADMEHTESRLRNALSPEELEYFFSTAEKLIGELENGGKNDQETE